MLWKKTWEPEAVLALLGGIVGAVFFCGIAGELLRRAGVSAFRSETSVGSVLLATLGFHVPVILFGAVFLKFQETNWREVFGPATKRNVMLAVAVLVVMGPVVLALKAGSMVLLQKLHYKVDEQQAVELILGAKPWVQVYLAVFAVIIAPLAEEFFFRGLLFSTAKRYGWRKLGYVGASALFALLHGNAPILVSLFVLALALTWLYEKTEGLLAPILTHSLFNLVNLVFLYAHKS